MLRAVFSLSNMALHGNNARLTTYGGKSLVHAVSSCITIYDNLTYVLAVLLVSRYFPLLVLRLLNSAHETYRPCQIVRYAS